MTGFVNAIVNDGLGPSLGFHAGAGADVCDGYVFDGKKSPTETMLSGRRV